MAIERSIILCFVATLLLPPVCQAASPPAVAPTNTPVDKEQFSKAKLTFKDEVVKNDHVVLEQGKEYEYSGSFQLTQVDDETVEHEEFIQHVQGSLGLRLVVDGEKSGYKLEALDDPPPTPVREVDTYGGKVKTTRFESPNIIHFRCRLKAPVQLGEHELRLFYVPQKNNLVNILTRRVQVVEPKAAKGN